MAVIGELADSSVGEDGVSARLLKAGGWPVAHLVHQHILDIIRLEYVPVIWRGGRLVVLYKGKGSPMLTDSFRGILVADHLSKIPTALLQWHLDK
eukprot:8934666-Karenia_brevis.AAC.1